MKAFKKITALVVALTMGCSVFAFAACNPEENDSNDSEKKEDNIVTSNLPTGLPAQTVDAGFASALKEEKDYLSVNYTGKESVTYSNYSKTNGVEDYRETTSYEINTMGSGKLDLTTGNADVVSKSVSTYESTNEDKDFSVELANTNYTEYGFLRDWEIFSYKTPDNKDVADFTGLELTYDGSAKINWEEILAELGSIGDSGEASLYAEDDSTPAFDLSMLPQTGDLAKLSLAGENVVLVNLAAAANTLEYENGVYSIDLIKTLGTIINEVGSVVYALQGKNTVGDILNNDIIKKYFSVITELVPVETVKASVDAAIDGLSTVDNQYVEGLLLYIQQDLDALKTIEASTTYDYIVSLVGSQNLVNILNTAVMIIQSQGSGASPASAADSDGVTGSGLLTKTLDKYTVNEIISLVNLTANLPLPITLQFIQNAYKKNVEPICDGEQLVLHTGGVITELSVEYKVESGKLVSQKVNYVYEDVYDYETGSSESDGVTAYHYMDYSKKQENTYEINYEASAPALKDISGNTASYPDGYEWDEEKLYSFSVRDYSSHGFVYVDFYISACVVDGEYAGFKLYNPEKELIGQDASSITFQFNNVSYVIRETEISSDTPGDVTFEVETEYGSVTNTHIFQSEVRSTSTVAEILEAKAI